MENPSSHHRNPGRAATLSLVFPGLGQLYCGNLIRALAFACASLVVGLLLAGLLTQTRSLFPALATALSLGVAVSVIAAIDAYHSAKRSEDYRLTELNRPLIYALFAVLTFGAALGGALGLSLLIRDRYVQAFVIPNQSMSPTILPGDRILAFKQVYLDDDPIRGDIVIFYSPENRRRHYIKRVIGLPGETVAIQDGKLLVNGSVSDPDGYKVNGLEEAEDFAEITVPDYHCFVLGDNRAESKDSRHFGPLGFGSITARVESRFWPLGRAGSIRSPAQDD